MLRSESLVVVANTVTKNENLRPGSTTVRLRPDFTVTLRPQPKGLGRWARSIRGVVLVCIFTRSPPQILHPRVQNDLFSYQ